VNWWVGELERGVGSDTFGVRPHVDVSGIEAVAEQAGLGDRAAGVRMPLRLNLLTIDTRPSDPPL